jgi:hypothetical protein
MAMRDRGATDAEFLSAIRFQFARAEHLFLRDTSDDLLGRYTRARLDQILAARAISDEACALLAQGRLDVTLTLPREVRDRELAILNEALNAPPAPVRSLSEDELTPYFQTLAGGLTEEQANVIRDPSAEVSPSLRCAASLAYYRGLVAMPDQARASMMRWLMTQYEQAEVESPVSQAAH